MSGMVNSPLPVRNYRKFVEHAVSALAIQSERIGFQFLLSPGIGDLFDTDSDLHAFDSFVG